MILNRKNIKCQVRADGKMVITARAAKNGPYAADDHDIGEVFSCPDEMIGQVVAVIVYRDDSPSGRRDRSYILLTANPKYIADGVPGNSNPTIRRHHGWRGTDNDVACDALGVRTIESVTDRSLKNGDFVRRVVLGRDLVANKD